MSAFSTISSTIYSDFNNAMDYIWKSPRLIENETKVELEKLDIYYPDAPDTAALRWHFESKRLDQVFPYLNSIGNLFGVMSLFEAYLVRIAKVIEDSSGAPISSTKGNGADRLLRYVRSQGIKIEDIGLYPQVVAGIKIRNCLFHATGMLEWSRDEEEIRRLQSSGTYLSREHRDRKVKSPREDEVRIVKHALGERLQVNNTYAWVLSYYLREFLIEVCSLADDLFGDDAT